MELIIKGSFDDIQKVLRAIASSKERHEIIMGHTITTGPELNEISDQLVEISARLQSVANNIILLNQQQ